MKSLRILMKWTHPTRAALAVLGYLLGVGWVRYLGRPLQLWTLGAGLVWTLCLVLSLGLLEEIFRTEEPLSNAESPAEQRRLRTLALTLAAGLLASAAWMAFLFLSQPLSWRLALLVFSGLITVLGLACVLPPLRLQARGWGEVCFSLLIADLFPAFGYLLQRGESHRFLIFLAFPLTLFTLAFFIVQNFRTFAADRKYQRLTLLLRLDWPRGAVLHQSLLGAGYLFFVLAPFFGFSLRLIWPVFLALPFAAFQAYLLQALVDGAPPQWRLLCYTSHTHLFLIFYLLLLHLWV